MILNNYKLLNSTGRPISFAGTATTQDTTPITQNTTANAYYSNSTAGWYVDVGFGDTPVDVDDYKLDDSNALDTPTLTFLSSTAPSTVTIGKALKTVTTIYANNTNNAVTVKEVGMVVKNNTSASTSNRNNLLTRTVLTTPAVIGAGKTMAFTASIYMND